MKFVRFRMLPEAKIMKRIQQNTFKNLQSNSVTLVFLRDLDLHFRFQMFKIHEIRSL